MVGVRIIKSKSRTTGYATTACGRSDIEQENTDISLLSSARIYK